MIAFAIIGLDMASAHTDTCSDEIAQLEALAESMGNPMAKPSLPQSTHAQLHHQPTPESVRRAEEGARLRFATALARAKILNAEGKTTDCMQSVTAAKRLLGVSWNDIRILIPSSSKAALDVKKYVAEKYLLMVENDPKLKAFTENTQDWYSFLFAMNAKRDEAISIRRCVSRRHYWMDPRPRNPRDSVAHEVGGRFDFQRALASRGEQTLESVFQRSDGHRPDTGVRDVKPSTRFGADWDSGLQVLWEDGERVFFRGESHADGDGTAVLAVLPAAEHPTRATLDRPRSCRSTATATSSASGKSARCCVSLAP
jgi:hypothetical protein